MTKKKSAHGMIIIDENLKLERTKATRRNESFDSEERS